MIAHHDGARRTGLATVALARGHLAHGDLEVSALGRLEQKWRSQFGTVLAKARAGMATTSTVKVRITRRRIVGRFPYLAADKPDLIDRVRVSLVQQRELLTSAARLAPAPFHRSRLLDRDQAEPAATRGEALVAARR